MEITERLENLQTDMAVFSWLSRAVDYPDEKLVESLFCDELIQSLPEGMAERMKAYIKAFSSGDELLLDLQKEYTRLCFVSKPRLVPLFESVYKEGKLYQDSTFQIARLYDEAGIKLGSEFKLPPDHIALELEFMSYLIYQEIEALKNGNADNEEMALRLQNETMHDHLMNFGLNFADRLTRHAQTPFYQGIGAVLKDLLQIELPRDQN